MPDNLAINYYLCKFILIWFFARFAVTLRLRLEGTFARKNKKIAFFLGFLLAYSYLCPQFWK